MQKITTFEGLNHLCEIYTTGLQFAFVSDQFEQAHQWVLCKDFLTDVLWSTVHDEPIEIYSFEYLPRDYPAISKDPVRLIVRNKAISQDEWERQIRQSKKFINKVEKKLGFKLAKLEKVEYDEHDPAKGGSVWMFTLDKRWIHASAMISMLTLYIRLGCQYDDESSINSTLKNFKKKYGVDEDGNRPNVPGAQDESLFNDADYLRKSHTLRQLIMKKGISIFAPKMEDNYPYEDTWTVHDYWGIVSSRTCSSFKNIWDLTGLKTVVPKKTTTKKVTVKKKVRVKNGE